MTSLPGHFRSNDIPDITSCHVTASSCELQPWRKWNVQYMRVFGLLQSLPGDFQSNDVTSGSLPVAWGHVTSFPVTWLPPPVSYSLEGSEMYSIRELLAYSHFQVTYCQMKSLPGHFRLLDVTWRHFQTRDCHLLRAIPLKEVKSTVYASFRPSTATFIWLSNHMTSLPRHFRSP